MRARSTIVKCWVDSESHGMTNMRAGPSKDTWMQTDGDGYI